MFNKTSYKYVIPKYFFYIMLSKENYFFCVSQKY